MNLRVVPRSGIGEFQNSEAVDDIEQRELPSVTEKGETFSSVIENGSAIQWCWRSYREPTHVGDSRPNRENFLSDSGPRCCNLPHSDARVPTANQRPRRGIVPHRWCWRYQTDDHTVVNYHKRVLEEHAAHRRRRQKKRENGERITARRASDGKEDGKRQCQIVKHSTMAKDDRNLDDDATQRTEVG